MGYSNQELTRIITYYVNNGNGYTSDVNLVTTAIGKASIANNEYYFLPSRGYKEGFGEWYIYVYKETEPGTMLIYNSYSDTDYSRSYKTRPIITLQSSVKVYLANTTYYVVN